MIATKMIFDRISMLGDLIFGWTVVKEVKVVRNVRGALHAGPHTGTISKANRLNLSRSL